MYKHKNKNKKGGSTQPAAVKGAVKITPVQPPSPFVDCLCFQKESKGFEQEKLSFASVSINNFGSNTTVPFVTSLALYIQTQASKLNCSFFFLDKNPIINFEVVSACVYHSKACTTPDVACVWNKIDGLPTSGGVSARELLARNRPKKSRCLRGAPAEREARAVILRGYIAGEHSERSSPSKF